MKIPIYTFQQQKYSTFGQHMFHSNLESKNEQKLSFKEKFKILNYFRKIQLRESDIQTKKITWNILRVRKLRSYNIQKSQKCKTFISKIADFF